MISAEKKSSFGEKLAFSQELKMNSINLYFSTMFIHKYCEVKTLSRQVPRQLVHESKIYFGFILSFSNLSASSQTYMYTTNNKYFF